MRRLCGVPGLWRDLAVIAVAALVWGLVGKVVEQYFAAAAGDFAEAEHGIQLVPLGAFKLFGAVGVLCHLLQAHHILQAVDHPGICGLAVAAGAAGFLIIGFDAFGQIQVGNKAHIWFIYAHAKGDGGDNNHAIFAQKAILMGLPQLGRQACMVG